MTAARPALAAVLSCLLAAAPLTTALGADWRVVEVAAPGRVDEIVATGRTAAIRIGRAWYRADPCPPGVCLAPGAPPKRSRPPAGGLPDGWVAYGSGPGIAEAWYHDPTKRYRHAILGDAVEAGALQARDTDGVRYHQRLPDDQVFEDLAPRIADIDGDGRNDIVAIRSSLDRGASLTVYGLDGGRLRLRGSTAPIGTAHRWLNVAGIADFDGDGGNDIAIVVTPHIGGRLEFWTWKKEGLTRTTAASGFSNHAIGSRAQSLSAVADVDGDDRPDLALPDAARRALMIVRLTAGRIETLARVPLPGQVIHDIAAIPAADGLGFLVGLDSGRLVAVLR